jgi:hypothetical protein
MTSFPRQGYAFHYFFLARGMLALAQVEASRQLDLPLVKMEHCVSTLVEIALGKAAFLVHSTAEL